MHFYSGTKRHKGQTAIRDTIMSQGSINPLQTIDEGLSEDERRVVSSLRLLNPDLLTAQYNNSKALASEAEGYVKAENLAVGKNRFESAAKLALYEGDPVSAKEYLEKAVAMEKNSLFSFALSNFANISKYVVESYKIKSVRVS